MTTKTFRNILKIADSDVNYVVNFSKKFRYIYVETPKVACSTIKRSLQIAEAAGDTSRIPEDVHHRARSPIPEIRNKPGLFAKLLDDPATLKFCFVRNPFSRALSCYLDKFVHNQGERRRMLPKLGFTDGSSVSFHDFLLAVSEQSDIERDMHWMSQSFLLQPETVRYDFIGRFEHLVPDLERLADELGLPERSWATVAPHATSATAKVREYLGPAETQLVQEIYANDFRTFGYGWSARIV